MRYQEDGAFEMRFKKIIASLLFISILFSQTWEIINPSFDTPGEHLLRNIEFVDQNTGWAFQYHPSAARIYKTTNGGYNWEVVMDTTHLLFIDIDFTDDGYGWICGHTSSSNEPFILRTIDYGNTWGLINNAPRVYALFFDTDLHGFASGDSIYETFDGGNSWIGRHVTPYSAGYIYDMFFLDDSHAWAVCTGPFLHSGSIIFSSNSGLTWEYLVNQSYESSSIFFKDSLNGLRVGGGGYSPGHIGITSDGGSNWNYNIFNSVSFRDIYFINDNLGWVVGHGGNLWVSDSSWNIWTQIDLGITENLYSIQFVENNTVGFISGANNTLLKYEVEASVTDNQSIPNKFAFNQNYPNPFNPTTTIQYELPQRSDVQITIYDLLGRKVTTLVSKIQEAGFKSVTWNATNDHGKPVSAGVYLYQIRVCDPDGVGTGKFVQTKKMVLLK